MTTLEKQRHQIKCRPVLQLSTTGKLINEYYSISEASRITSVGRTSISNALAQESGIHLAGGFIWRYTDSFTDEQLERIRNELNVIR